MGGSPCLLLVLLMSAFAINSSGQRLDNKQIYKTRRLPGLDVCGKNIINFDEKIINGKPAELGAFPWMANIGYSRNEDGGGNIGWQCAGSLITDQYVITAAHCVHPSTIRTRRTTLYATKVRLGELDLNPAVDDGATPMDYDIESIKWHEQYSNSRKENDIALIKLKEKVKFTQLIRPICLPPPQFQQNLFVGYFPAIAGWGKSVLNPQPNSLKDTRLLEAEVEIQDTASCKRNITSLPELRSAIIDHRVVCAASPGKDSCQGDSGGPLMLSLDIRPNDSNKIGNYFLMGVVSYGYKCAIEGYPGVYTRVSEYMGWLLDNMDV